MSKGESRIFMWAIQKKNNNTRVLIIYRNKETFVYILYILYIIEEKD